MNFGVTSVAAPNAASSRTARYSFDGASRGLRRKSLLALDTLLPVRLRLDQAGIDRKAFAADQALTDAAPQHRLKQPSEQVALAEAAVPVLRERGMIRHAAVEPEPAEPAVRQIEVDLLAQAPLGADAEAIAHDQHPDHQFGIDRWPTHRAVEGGQLPPQLAEFDEPVDRPQADDRPECASQARTHRTKQPVRLADVPS